MKMVSYPTDKWQWHPSLIPGVVVWISTYDTAGKPNIAPKSWVQMVSFTPPMLMFSGTKGNPTERNIIESGCFGVNFLDSTNVGKAFDCLQWHGAERIEKSGLEIVKATKVNAPLVKGCRAHLECKLVDTKEVGTGFVIFGEIVAASIWDEVLKVEEVERYRRLDLVVYLEEKRFAPIGEVIDVEGKA